MRHLAFVVGLLALLLAPAFGAAPARVFATPKALLDYAYSAYSTRDFQDDNDILYSKALNALFATAEANTSDDEAGPVDFDVFVNGQDFQLTELKIGDPSPEGDGVTVPVTFKNFGEPQSLVFHLIREGEGWKINDIESLTPNSSWRLTTLLTPDNTPDDDSAAAPAAGATPPNAPPPAPSN